MDSRKIIDIIYKLNDHLPENSEFSFSYSSNGYVELITFGQDIIIWNSEEDNRFWDRVNGYEDMYNFCTRTFNEYIDNLVKLKFDE